MALKNYILMFYVDVIQSYFTGTRTVQSSAV